MSSFTRHSYLGTLGDLPVKSGGEKVILSSDDDNPYNVLTGELVVWDFRKNVSLDAGDIATADNISIAVGVGEENSLATDLVHLGGNNFNLCDTKFHNRVSRPRQGTPQIVDVFFNEVECDETYSIVIRLDDSRIRSIYDYNQKADYAYEISFPCTDCDSCDTKGNGDELACAFVDAINDTNLPPKELRPYFQHDSGDTQYKPFKAVRLFSGNTATKDFCLSPSDNNCEDCAEYEGITGIRVDGVNHSFSYTTKPGDTTVTLPGQLKRVVNETNRVLESIGGSAVLKDTIGKCYGRGIEINSCADTIEYITDGDNITPCNEYDPFTEREREQICKSCDSEPESITFAYGFRIIVDHVEDDCNCEFPPNERTPNYYGRTVDVQFNGEAWRCDDHWSKVSQEQQLPKGFGYFLQDQAHYKQDNAGRGRNWRNSNRYVGRLGLPDQWSRATNAINNIKCDETYCVYSSIYQITKKPSSSPSNAQTYSNTGLGVVAIPSNHDTTKSSWESYLEALNERGICTGGEVQCDIVVEVTGTTTVQEAATTQLSASVSPDTINSEGTWSSSDEAVATVDDTGLVTGVSAGTATITFTNTQTGVSDSVDVTVTAP